MSSPQQPETPPAPSQSGSYNTGINTYLSSLNRLLGRENTERFQNDPQRIAWQQQLQSMFGPTQYSQMLQGLQSLDPQWLANNRQLGTMIGNNLANPENQAQYKTLGSQTAEDLAAGYGLAPGQQHQLEQQVRGSQSARGNTLGSAAGTAEAYALGDRGYQMHQQRLSNSSNYLNMQSPQQRAMANAFQYNQSATPSQMAASIPPIMPDRSMAYVNPNAGFQGQNFALNNYQNQLAQSGLQGPQSNPWATGLGAAGSVVGGLVGSYYGGPVGGAAGSYAGGQAGSAIGGLFNKGGEVDGGYAKGGRVKPSARPLKGYGMDTVPAALTPGEVVIPRPGDTSEARRNYLLNMAKGKRRVGLNQGGGGEIGYGEDGKPIEGSTVSSFTTPGGQGPIQNVSWDDPNILPTPIPAMSPKQEWAAYGGSRDSYNRRLAELNPRQFLQLNNNPYSGGFNPFNTWGNMPPGGLPGSWQGQTLHNTWFDPQGFPYAMAATADSGGSGPAPHTPKKMNQ